MNGTNDYYKAGMSDIKRKDIQPGMRVSIVLKQDQINQGVVLAVYLVHGHNQKEHVVCHIGLICVKR